MDDVRLTSSDVEFIEMAAAGPASHIGMWPNRLEHGKDGRPIEVEERKMLDITALSFIEDVLPIAILRGALKSQPRLYSLLRKSRCVSRGARPTIEATDSR